MKVLFFTVASFPGIEHRGIYTDLLREFRNRGDEVYVVCPNERRHGRPTELVADNGVGVLRVRTGNITGCGLVEKALSTLLIERQFRAAIDRHLLNVHFDLVMYSTPPVTFDRIVSYVKSRDKCTTYLLLKDIFPQNAVDLGLMRQGGLAHRYFRAREQRLYAVSDWIGCMSRANIAYLLAHNPGVPHASVEVCANSVSPVPAGTALGPTRAELGIPEGRVVFVYGGNLGRPQGVDFVLECLHSVRHLDDVFILVIGAGTEYARVAQEVEQSRLPNVQVRKALPRNEYDALIRACDVGLIFLDKRFTIPNFPSRLTAYMEAGLPVVAATDYTTDMRGVLEGSGSGLWVPSDDVEAFLKAVRMLASNTALRERMGCASRQYLEDHYTVGRAYETITGHLVNPQVVNS